MAINLTSTAFKDGEDIPKKHTCDGVNVSPHLQWDGVPAQTNSIALVCDDPDAPGGMWVHWVIYNIPADYVELTEGVAKSSLKRDETEEELENGARQGTNDFGKFGYGGPCPPKGSRHRYFFKIYALDAVMDANAGGTKEELIDAMGGHILAEGKLMGRFGR